MSREDQEAAELSQLFVDAETSVAQYIVQVSLNHRKDAMAYPGMLTLWRKGLSHFGVADQALLWCPEYGCLGHVSGSFALDERSQDRILESGVRFEDFEKWPQDLKDRYFAWEKGDVTCPVCGVTSLRKNLAEAYIFVLPLAKIADHVETLVRGFNLDADVYVVRNTSNRTLNAVMADVRVGALTRRDEVRAALSGARAREQVYYKAVDIAADTANGASISSRILALLKA